MENRNVFYIYTHEACELQQKPQEKHKKRRRDIGSPPVVCDLVLLGLAVAREKNKRLAQGNKDGLLLSYVKRKKAWGKRVIRLLAIRQAYRGFG